MNRNEEERIQKNEPEILDLVCHHATCFGLIKLCLFVNESEMPVVFFCFFKVFSGVMEREIK